MSRNNERDPASSSTTRMLGLSLMRFLLTTQVPAESWSGSGLPPNSAEREGPPIPRERDREAYDQLLSKCGESVEGGADPHVVVLSQTQRLMLDSTLMRIRFAQI